MIILKIGELLKKQNAETRKLELNKEHDFEDEDIKLLKPLKGEITLIRTSKGINAAIENFETEIELTCSRCLKKYRQKIEIPLIEEHYYIEMPEDALPVDQISLIDQKYHQIDIAEPIRQEILLKFPLIPLCLDSCKGLCSNCGIDLNKKSCSCKREVILRNRPFEKLKSIL